MARYRDAIRWLADNDDNEWVDIHPDEGGGALSVAASLAADLFGKADEQVRADLKRELVHRERIARAAVRRVSRQARRIA